MATLNKVGAKFLRKYKARACTDITGFGIQGHASFLAGCQNNEVDFKINALPIFKNALKMDKIVHNFNLKEGKSAETSGGLLACIAKENVDDFVKEMRDNG